MKKVEDIEKLKIINPLKDGKLPVLIEALEKIRDQVGDVASIGAAMTGPFSVAASVLGTETLLRWMVKKKDAVHKIMDIITINNGEYIKEVGSRGFGIGFADPVSSTTLIRKKQFEEFSLPYLKRNIADVKKSVKECIDIGYDSPCGYVLSTGCQIPKGTKLENIDAFMEYGREFGNYKRLKELKNETK